LFDAGGQTDMTKLIVDFRNFANAPKKLCAGIVLDILLRIENVRIKTLLLYTFSPHIHIRIVSVADDQSLTRTYRWYEHLNCRIFRTQ
jgi:hypothetical protein